MKIDLIKLLLVFDELLPQTDEEQKIYWLKSTRNDGVAVTCVISVYEEIISLIIYKNHDAAVASLDFINCSEINVVDENRKCIEILHNNSGGRGFLSLSDGTVLTYTESDPKVTKNA
jgi:hypothetical protein